MLAVGTMLLAAPSRAESSAAGSTAADPVAVMPFKNLNQDPKLGWLSVGIAETMITDLRKSKAVQIVERGQLDSALAELLLQGVEGGEVSTAVKAGKLVGARTMVLGSYQRAGKQLRIAARFVSVETGLVTRTAKVTGKETRVFHLQDQIVASLLGKKLKKKAKLKARRPEGEKAFKAYELYAMSLTAFTSVQRVKFLKASLKLDPEFSYAIEDLNELEQRLKRYDKEAQRVQNLRTEELREQFDQAGITPEQRSQRAWMLLANHMQSFRYGSLLKDSRYLQQQDLSPYAGYDVGEYAAYSEFLALQMLKKYNLALQVGERYLARYPGGTYYISVKTSMGALMGQIQRREQGKAALEEDLAEIEEDRAEVIARAEKRDEPVPRQRLMGFDLRRCAAASQNHQHQLALQECGAFARKYADEEAEAAHEWVLNARWYLVLSNMELGRFDRARKLGDALIADEPEWSRGRSLSTILSTLPKD